MGMSEKEELFEVRKEMNELNHIQKPEEPLSEEQKQTLREMDF